MRTKVIFMYSIKIWTSGQGKSCDFFLFYLLFSFYFIWCLFSVRKVMWLFKKYVFLAWLWIQKFYLIGEERSGFSSEFTPLSKSGPSPQGIFSPSFSCLLKSKSASPHHVFMYKTTCIPFTCVRAELHAFLLDWYYNHELLKEILTEVF